MVNLSCPGETTGSFLSPEREDAAGNYCSDALDQGSGYRDLYPLHVDYDGPQLDEAVRVLTGQRITLVTLQIGGNDALLCVGAGQCSTPAELAALTDRIEDNLDTILDTLRGEGGYRGTVVLLTYARPGATNAALDSAIEATNDAIEATARASGTELADEAAAFREAADGDDDLVAAGLIRPNDVHPTDRGQRIIADTVEDVL